MVTLANAFAASGYLVDLVLARAAGPYRKDVTNLVRVVDLGADGVLGSLPGLVRYLCNVRPQAMLSAMNHANVIAILAHALSRSSARLVVSERSHLSLSLRSNRSLRTRSLPALMRLIYPIANAVIAVSKGVADDLHHVIGLPRDRIHVVYNPVVRPRLYEQASSALDHPWFNPREAPVILGMGRLTQAKDFTTLIRAFAYVRQRRNVRLMILGEGELRGALEALVRSHELERHVALPGFVENPFAYLHNAALFVLSSRWEGLPGALIEAMACGTPVVSTDCPSGPAEILERGKWGCLVPVGNVDALAQAMLKTLAETAHPDVAARAQAFSVDQAMKGYLNALGLPISTLFSEDKG